MNVILYGKCFVDMIKFRIFRWGDNFGLFGKVLNEIIDVFIRGK